MLIFALIFVLRQDRSHPPQPYSLNFHLSYGTSVKLSPTFLHHRFGLPRSHGFRVMSRPNTLCKDEASIYCTSIKQRERSYFRQLKLINRDYSAGQRRTACLQTTSARCQNRSAPSVKGDDLKIISIVYRSSTSDTSDRLSTAKIHHFLRKRKAGCEIYRLFHS